MTNVVPIGRNVRIPDGDVADEETVKMLEEALQRAKRGEIQSVVIVGIQSNFDTIRFKYCQDEIHLRLILSGLLTEAANVTDHLNMTSDILEPIEEADEDEPA